MGHTLLGTDKWIGAVECCALLRYFGIRAEVVDFSRKSLSVLIIRKSCNTLTELGKSSKLNVTSENVQSKLEHWVKKYFQARSSKVIEIDANSSSAVEMKLQSNDPISRLDGYIPPLYFQHEGHSRTIIGKNVVRLIDVKRSAKVYRLTSVLIRLYRI